MVGNFNLKNIQVILIEFYPLKPDWYYAIYSQIHSIFADKMLWFHYSCFKKKEKKWHKGKTIKRGGDFQSL